MTIFIRSITLKSMDLFWRLLEKMLTSLVISAIIFMLSFSYLTGKFPPRKADVVRSFSLMKQIVGSQGEFNKHAQALQNSNGEMSLEQMAEFQRLNLRRTEIGLEMLGIFNKLKFTTVNPELEQRLRVITEHITAAEQELGKITEHLQQEENK